MNESFPIRQLSDLQEVDTVLLSRKSALDEVQAKLADNSAVESAQRALQGFESQLSQHTPIRAEIESQIQQLNERIRVVDERLYSGSVNNPRELSAYQEEKAMFERQMAAEEEKLLEVMVQIEDLQKSRDSARDTFSGLSSQREQEVSSLKEMEQRLVGEINQLSDTRSDISADLPAPALFTYDNLLRTRNGQAVAKVERGICQGCRISIPNGILQRARSATGPVQCTSCRRLIYVV